MSTEDTPERHASQEAYRNELAIDSARQREAMWAYFHIMLAVIEHDANPGPAPIRRVAGGQEAEPIRPGDDHER